MNNDQTAPTSENEPAGPNDQACGLYAGLYTIALTLLSARDWEQTLDAVTHKAKSLAQQPENARIWAEIDGASFGDRPADHAVCEAQPVIVDGARRGRICLAYDFQTEIAEEDQQLVHGLAELAAAAVLRNDEQKAVHAARDRAERKSGNLEREMWSRTDALASKTGYLEGILRCSDDMIITTDLDSRIVEFNPGAEKILGYSAEEVQGKNIADIWERAEERESILEQISESGGIKNYETRLKTKSGHCREVSLTLSLLRDGEGRVIGTVGISKDNTEEKAIVRELELLNRNYRETIHFINHEFKNSLLVIGGFLRRLIDTETDPKREEQLKIVYHHSKFLEAMSLDFLVMAELEHGEFQIRKAPIKDFYGEVILPAMIGLKERYPDSFQSYDTSMGGIAPREIPGDPNLLQIVFRNLFGNALKYRTKNGTVAYGMQEVPEGYLFNVWNEGPGVSADMTEKIFEKFYRVSDETTRSKKGTGLGLYNIRKIIEAHGGRIWCETQPGRWINFLFLLPKE